MSTFSSVVRKPGQKITPKTAPRRNVQRHPARPAAPPSLTPESQSATDIQDVVEERTVTEARTVTENRTVDESLTVTESERGHADRTVTPDDGQVVKRPKEQHGTEAHLATSDTQVPAQAQPILESTEIPPSSAPVETSVPLSVPLETVARSSPEASPSITAPTPVDAVEVIVPSSAGPDATIIHPVHLTTSPVRTLSIPVITTSGASTAPRRCRTNELTPAPSEVSNHAIDTGEESPEQSPGRSNKRQKITHPTETNNETESRVTPPLTENTPLILRSSPRHRRSESRTSEALLQDATSQAAAVSELAHSIENSARSLRPRSTRAAVSTTETESPDEDVSEAEIYEPTRRKGTRRKQQRAQAIEDIARQVVENAVGGSGRGRQRRLSRLPTPEDAEERSIDPEEISMGDLVRDNKLGKKSETEKKMQQNWEDIKRRRQEEVERRREAAAQRKHGRQILTSNQDAPVEESQVHVPQQIIVNGQIVVAAESREVAFGAGVEQAVIKDADVALEDDRIYKYVHQGTLGKHAGRRRGTRWDDEQTELFYKGLRMFGTDFSMIANLFPSLDRKQIKLKFLIEERAHPVRVKRSVAAKEPVDIDEYSMLTNQQFEDPAALQAELDAEEKRLREEDERRRANEGYVVDSADIALPSTERDRDHIDGAESNDTGATGRQEHIAHLARGAVATVTAPARKQGQLRKKEPLGRGRQGKKGRIPMEGVEERIGPIEEVYQ
ncbi:hypothetical protein A1O1_05769 [Capronia coronata CBS 617.96]|uniref:Myb-like domain-containing protein n=1 Tax=Capronia coronata CBS 617.96 TaxID=1182541 RepID=W9Y723_9EURO|nr:uncharacterized protein A1O1_05769 [Capronia coronata CBS 617.96]EXJ85405.1 hypothetical protein A1O1_05769 [Capronia coronata CBS 617.96]